jgi:flagellar motor switch protein FliN/FliY
MTSHDDNMTLLATEIELEAPSEAGSPGRLLLGARWPFLGSVKVQVSVRVGGAEVSVAELAGLKQGAVLSLDRLVDEPLDVLVDGHVVAQGMLVAIGEHFGVRITETAVVTPAAS